MEAMLAKGYSVQEAMDYMMKHGKTEGEELKDTLKKDISQISNEEKLRFFKKGLLAESEAVIDDLFAQGYTMAEIIDIIKRHGNNLKMIEKELSKPKENIDMSPIYAKNSGSRLLLFKSYPRMYAVVGVSNRATDLSQVTRNIL